MSLSIDNKYVRLLSFRLRNFKQKKDGLYNFSCPICGDSKKNQFKARGYVFQKGNELFYRCHNCGAGTNIGGLLKSIDGNLYKEYTLERYKAGVTNNHTSANAVLQLSVPKFGKVEKQKTFEHAEWCDKLPAGHFCLEYLERRQIPKECYKSLLFTNKYRQFVTALVPNLDKQIVDDARLVIPFYDENDEMIAVSGRALETGDKTLRYVTIRTNNNQNKLIYGMDRVNLSENVYLVEGPIDSLFISNCLASADANLAVTAKDIDAKKIILIFDNEPRNKEIVKMVQNAIKSDHNVVIWPNTVAGKDINEMVMNGKSPGEIQQIISNNTFNGLMAQLRFNSWKRV